MAEDHPKKSFTGRLRSKYFFIIRKEENFEEKLSLRFSPIGIFLVTGGLTVLLIVLVIYVVAFTPLREYIPGYADVNVRRNLILFSRKTDSLTEALKERKAYMENISRILNGTAGETDSSGSKKSESGDSIAKANHNTTVAPPSHSDSILRSEVESNDPYNLSQPNITEAASSSGSGINDYFFFCPLKGVITNGFAPAQSHYGVDVVAKENEAIKATLNGSVILSTWTLATGNVIILQHDNNLLSVYEHNSVLLKKTGDYVKAGDVIAIIGNTGELTTGPHLHFELWYKGKPVNPLKYITF